MKDVFLPSHPTEGAHYLDVTFQTGTTIFDSVEAIFLRWDRIRNVFARLRHRKLFVTLLFHKWKNTEKHYCYKTSLIFLLNVKKDLRTFYATASQCLLPCNKIKWKRIFWNILNSIHVPAVSTLTGMCHSLQYAIQSSAFTDDFLHGLQNRLFVNEHLTCASWRNFIRFLPIIEKARRLNNVSIVA